MKGCAPGLVLKQRQKATLKWPIIFAYYLILQLVLSPSTGQTGRDPRESLEQEVNNPFAVGDNMASL